MDDQEFLEVFRQSANLLREQTVQQLLEDNAAYEEICRQEGRKGGGQKVQVCEEKT